MKEAFFETIQGQKVRILELSMFCVNSQLELILKVTFNHTTSVMLFHNVSRVSIQNLSMPMEIHGFEVVSHKQKGWELDSNYEVRDFEDDRIRFFCEGIETEI